MLEGAVGVDLTFDVHLQQRSRFDVEGRFFQLLSRHFAEAFEPRDLVLSIGCQAAGDFFFVSIVLSVVDLRADRDAVQRRLGEEDLALADEVDHVAEEKCQQQRADVVAVTVRIHEQDNSAVPQPTDVEAVSDSRSESLNEILEFLVCQDS